MESMIDFYNGQVEGFAEHCRTADIGEPKAADVDRLIDLDPKKISWDRADKGRIAEGERYTFRDDRIFISAYRPFTREFSYFDQKLNNTVYQIPRMFPTPEHEKFGFYSVGNRSAVPFSVLILNSVPDLHVTGAGSVGQFFPRYTYRELSKDDDLLATAEDEGYERVDSITDAALRDSARPTRTTP
jgi:predicted helicase